MDRLHGRRAHSAEFEEALAYAGLVDIEIRETHRVHEHAELGDRAGAQARAPIEERPHDAGAYRLLLALGASMRPATA